MKVLLDECVDTRLAPYIDCFKTHTVHDLGWSGIANGRLLALAEVEFDVFITVDRNLSFQQNLPRFSIAVVLIHAPSNRIAELLQFVPELLEATPRASRGALTHIGG